jgi:hypothetical protein
LTNNAGSFFDSSITTFTKTFALLLFNTLLIFLEKIYCPEEQREQANKALQLNGDIYPDHDSKLLAAFCFILTLPLMFTNKNKRKQ